MKACTKCNSFKDDSEFRLDRGYRRGECRDCGKALSREYRRQNPEDTKHRNRRTALNKYGLTPAEFDYMLVVQSGRCVICDKIPTNTLNVDHCHTSGEVRGLLCGECNRGLGMFYDNPAFLRSAATYLEKYNEAY